MSITESAQVQRVEASRGGSRGGSRETGEGRGSRNEGRVWGEGVGRVSRERGEGRGLERPAVCTSPHYTPPAPHLSQVVI